MNYRTRPWFLNVDLQIESAPGTALDSLAAALGKRVIVLHCGPMARTKRQHLALESSEQHKTPDATIHALCDAVEKLAPAARRVWDAAQKEFDAGYELRPSQRWSRFNLRIDTLQRMTSLGATLAVTYYRGESPK